MNLTKTPQPPAARSAAPSAGSAATSTPIYDALVREWYAEGRDAGGAQRDENADAA